MLLTAHSAEYVEVDPGPPLGIGPTTYASTTFTMSRGSTLVCFTDGLIERRTESIDTGMRRLVAAARESEGDSADVLVSRTVAALRVDDAADDVAVLALRWNPSRRGHGS